MARASIWLQKFDPAADYVVSRGFLLSGTEQRPGELFDKTRCTRRTLRQLYEQRKVQMAAAVDGPASDLSDPPFKMPPETQEAKPKPKRAAAKRKRAAAR